MMLTELTVTNEQIRKLRAWTMRRFTSMVPVSRGHWIAPERCVQLCDDAIEELFDACAREPMPARAQCAAIINAINQYEPEPLFPPAEPSPGRIVCPNCNGYRVRVHMGGGQVPCEKCDDGTIPDNTPPKTREG